MLTYLNFFFICGMTGVLDDFEKCPSVILYAPPLDVIALLVGIKKHTVDGSAGTVAIEQTVDA